jgi:hypothetical protein
MKTTRILLLFLISLKSFSQTKLENKDLNNLIAIAEIYSKNPNAKGEAFAKSIDSLRTPKLNHIAEVLIEIGKGDLGMLESNILTRPSNEELMMWYVIREIHYNRVNKTKIPKESKVVANDILSQKIDERWLLDNYYYRIRGGIATLFNEADLSNKNIDIETLGFKNQTEKAIFYLAFIDALVGGRFKVLKSLKKNDKIIEFVNKLPKINGLDYYNYKDLDFEDFEWIGYDKIESYKEVHINNLYEVLISQFIAIGEKDKKQGQEMYFNSILHEPKYFKFSKAKEDLEFVYEKSK